MGDGERLIAGRYRLTRRLGSGGMGVVWHGVDERLHRPVAVKELRLPPHLTGDEAEQAKLRAMRESRIAARVQHPHVIGIYDVVEDEGHPCLVMEYLPSRSLSEVLAERGTLPPSEVAHLGAQAARALEAAHVAGVVHRDVKPGNVLLGDAGTAKIADFGISRAVGDVTLTATGLISGTPAYLAPEVAKGLDATSASDVFSLGSTLYTAVEGAPPFGLHDNPIALLHQVATGEPTPPRLAGPLSGVLMAMLAREPERRPTMREIGDRLATIAAGRTSAPPPARVAGPGPGQGVRLERTSTLPFPNTTPRDPQGSADARTARDPRTSAGQVARRDPGVRSEAAPSAPAAVAAGTATTPPDAQRPAQDGSTPRLRFERASGAEAGPSGAGSDGDTGPGSTRGAGPEPGVGLDHGPGAGPDHGPGAGPGSEAGAGADSNGAQDSVRAFSLDADVAAYRARSTRRRAWLAAGLAAALVAAGLVVALVLTRRDAQDPASRPAAGTTSSPKSPSPSSPSPRPTAEHKPQRTAPPKVTTGEALKAYYALLPRNTLEAYSRLTAKYKGTVPHGYSGYKGFWDDIRSVAISNVYQWGGNKLEARLTYVSVTGKVSHERRVFTMVKDRNGRWLIDASRVVPLTR